MSLSKPQVTFSEALAGTSLIMVGFAGMLVRLGVLDLSRIPEWGAMEHWWPLLLIIVGLVTWLAEMEEIEPAQPRGSVEMPYGK